ncbi:ChaN family lipoprotein [Endozoicomonas sp. SM1973]|uniref:ChaN family lipoprotein n=1 Tax=Spartinivicinus marinus TaxID=2994442 RepID=A0A853I1P2_9GAMM|nr:ChaN family lipoprotein [Spartinivicinus marinus]NYZ67323.1 ChaN family lipoprotein [Spartinivicinus marinus]
MSKLLKLSWLFCFYSVISGCAATVEKQSEKPIWQQQNSQLITEADLLKKLPEVDVLYLGEAHDNPVHHQHQLAILEYLQAKGELAGVVMEMLNSDQQAKIDGAYGKVNSQTELYNWLEWQQIKGWQWDFYGPMMWLAIKNNIPLKAGNITRKQIMALYHSSTKPKAEGPYIGAIREPLAKRIEEAHCNKIDQKSLVAMVNIQQARDKKLAEEAVKLSDGMKSGVKVIITGSFHARKDVGSPQFVQWLAPNVNVASVIFIEANEEQLPEVSNNKRSTSAPWYKGVEPWGDWLWRTPKADTNRPDCG